ncbi:DNA-formamidopyrimidine glycosylase family protein [Ramlibacter albus]|uniref:Endonuclease n=1 Tax=Ramlibacter albus TaxID=2079448 RepID=A0A923S495_9BURK|nr:DNA-formamidopyrimidine glycosylase family protein [Ramlibacter albus]MBC5767359.1 endonuclease [Ramlibacter albus]
MPEGPSIVILREQAAKFAGQRIERVEGNTTIEKERLLGHKVEQLRSWGKHFLIELDVDFSLRVHFMLFGSYRIDERKSWAVPRLSLAFANGELNLYACSVRFVEVPLDLLYDWSADVMSDAWDPKQALKRLRARPDMLACDALLDQDIFAGVGNIIKNEVLFRIRVHPCSTVGAMPAAKLRELVKQARQYSFDFYEWKKQFVLKKHWLAHTKRTCPRCKIPLKKAHLGLTNRRSFFCENCQVRY